jgi:hypothetical protein
MGSHETDGRHAEGNTTCRSNYVSPSVLFLVARVHFPPRQGLGLDIDGRNTIADIETP